MIKLVSVNMEGARHIPRILGLIVREQPECIALQEAPESFTTNLQELGYHTAFAKMQQRTENGIETNEGVLFASKYPFTHHTEYYHYIGTGGTPHVLGDRIISASFPYLFATITTENRETYSIATVHAPVTNDGHSDEDQITGIRQLLVLLSKEEPHILCGDFNMPRDINTLYTDVTGHYTDTIPKKYTSSLDRNLHRCGKSTTLNAPIFDIYMVDYIFTKSPYSARDVRLEFGISDHAAVIGYLKNN